MIASQPCTLLLLLLGLLTLRPDDKPPAGQVFFTGKETLTEAVAALRKSGNHVADPPPVVREFKLPAGTHTFWPALDELCRQARLVARLVNDGIELTPGESKYVPHYVAYDGPFRAVISRRTITAYDHPGLGLDRLLLQVELTCEPRMQPLLVQLPSNGLAWKWTGTDHTGSARAGTASYGFDGEKMRTFELRLPRPERAVTHIDQLSVQGKVWLSAQRLDFDLPVKVEAESTKQQTTFRIQQVNELPGRTWEVVTTLAYPPESMEWESHQAGLLGTLSLTLVNGNQSLTSLGREVRTDQAQRLEIRWLFRNAPGRPDAWRARAVVPSPPLPYPLKLEFKAIPLP